MTLCLGLVPRAAAADADCQRLLGGIDLQTATILDLQAAMWAGEATSRDLVEAYVKRIATYDAGGPRLNSVRELHPRALAQADELDAERAAGHVRGPLHGVPILLKDNVGTGDMPTTAGSIALEGSIPKNDAFLTARLREAGAVILGKTNLSEFANWVALGMPNGYSSLGGQVINAHNFGDPSGSSSGSGVAGSMAFAAGTIGTETSGSILSPSNSNGLVGIKPTVGLVSRAGIIPLAQSFDTAGPMTRNVTDAAVILGAVAGYDPRDPKTSESQGHIPPGNDYTPFLTTSLEGVRIGVPAPDMTGFDQRAEVAIQNRALEDLERAGATLVPIRTLPLTQTVGLVELGAIPNEFKYGLNKYLAEETVPDLRVHTLTEIIEYNRQHPDRVRYGQNLLEISDMTLGIYDEPSAIALRTAAIYGSRAAIEEQLLEHDLDAIVGLGAAYANVGAAAGYPTVIVPAGNVRGGRFTVGISFLGTAYSESRLLHYAYAYEQASLRRVPPTELNPSLVPSDCTPLAA